MIALITGGTRGIGKACAEVLRYAGYTVVTVARADADIVADLTNRYERSTVIHRCFDSYGGIDVLINNAGEQKASPAFTYSLLDWRVQLELLLTAPFELSQHAARYMLIQKRGRIINMASVAGITGTRGVIGYSVAKAGLIEMTKCLSNEWLPYGITVNAVAPGFIETEMQTLNKDEPHGQAMLGRIPAARFGLPHEVAQAVLWLCSEKAAYVSGITLPVDGGWLAR